MAVKIARGLCFFGLFWFEISQNRIVSMPRRTKSNRLVRKIRGSFMRSGVFHAHRAKDAERRNGRATVASQGAITTHPILNSATLGRYRSDVQIFWYPLTLKTVVLAASTVDVDYAWTHRFF